MMEKREKVVSSIANIYKLDGRVPLSKAIPFGLQHILAMFVANLTPIMMIGSASSVGQDQMTILLQNAMFMLPHPQLHLTELPRHGLRCTQAQLRASWSV